MNCSEKRKNEIRQLLYCLYRSKELTNNSTKVWLTLVKNGNSLHEHWNCKRKEPHRFKLDLTDKRNLKNPNENMAFANLLFITLEKI